MSSKKKNKKKEKVILNINAPLFAYIKPRDNDQFSEMKGIDLQELIYYVENYYLELRNCLGLEENITIGLEIEAENAIRENISDDLTKENLQDLWKVKGDSSLYKGVEINSPILKDISKSWKDLKKVCSIVQKNATIGKSSGGHIHIGTQLIGKSPDSWLHFIQLWSVYENVIYRFTDGNFLTARPSVNEYALPIAKTFWDVYQNLKEYSHLTSSQIIKEINYKRYQAINFGNIDYLDKMEYGNTIEFRCPNNTVDPVIWQNNVNLFVHILKYAKSSKFNEDIVEKRRNINEEKYASLIWYNEIFLQQALELCDMLFTCNYDKVYFLRQYLKSFETGSKELSCAKPFTRNLKT